jgi:signal transduction histidine kinase
MTHDDHARSMLRFGLSRAIQVHSEGLRANHPNLSLDLDLVDDEGLLPGAVCHELYQVYLEAMSNVIHHAEATCVWVRYYPAETGMMLEIKDDGKGFSIPADWVKFASTHSGVMGMKPRIEALNGKLHIESKPGEGTVIQVRVPLKE